MPAEITILQTSELVISKGMLHQLKQRLRQVQEDLQLEKLIWQLMEGTQSE